MGSFGQLAAMHGTGGDGRRCCFGGEEMGRDLEDFATWLRFFQRVNAHVLWHVVPPLARNLIAEGSLLVTIKGCRGVHLFKLEFNERIEWKKTS